jgi:hypothetical protein
VWISSLQRRKRGARLLVLVVAGAGAAMTVAPPGAGAGGDAQAFVAMASASSARLTWMVPGQFAVEEVADGGGPIAQSRLDSGSSESFASLPYPGGSAVAYQGLLNVATGISSPFAYPFFVQAANPGQPKGELADPSGSGTYRLNAEAGAGTTNALARFRPGSPEAVISGGEATTSIKVDGGTVTSTADSVSEAVALGGGALRIGSVRSRSVTTYTDGAEAPKTETALVVDGLSAGDTRFGVGPGGFVVLGQPVPFAPKDAHALLDQILAPAGLSLRFVPAQPLTGGSSAAALEIVSKQPQPQFPASNITLRLGGASSAVSLGEGPLPLPAPDVTGGGSATPAPPEPTPASTGTPDAAPPGGAVDNAHLANGTVPEPIYPVTSGSPSAAFPPLSAVPSASAVDSVAAQADQLPSSAPAVGDTSLATQPIVRPRDIGGSRLIYGIVGGAAALMLLLGGAVTRRGGAGAWLDA